jgi:lambda family phage portal protein
MSKFTDTLRQFFGLQKPLKKATHKRLYSGANVNRLNKDWTTIPYTANHSLYRDLRILRARSRDMCANSPHFKKFLDMVRSNVVGAKGLQLQVRARKVRGKLDTVLNKLVAEIFWQWGMPETCTVTGKLDWIGCQRLFVTHLARDGEALVQIVTPKENPFGFALKFWNVDYLDETYNEELSEGRRIIMSVEIDANDRPIAYWLTTPASDINFSRGRARTRTRIPAEQIIHSYLVRMKSRKSAASRGSMRPCSPAGICTSTKAASSIQQR